MNIFAFLASFFKDKFCFGPKFLTLMFLRDLKYAFDEVSSEFEVARAQQRLRANSTGEEGVVSQSLGTFAMFGSVSRLVCGRNISGSPFTSGGQANR